MCTNCRLIIKQFADKTWPWMNYKENRILKLEKNLEIKIDWRTK
jgi:hypothetical protein